MPFYSRFSRVLERMKLHKDLFLMEVQVESMRDVANSLEALKEQASKTENLDEMQAYSKQALEESLTISKGVSY